MMDELIQLRNDKIKLMAEVDVLSKQLQRLEENERQAKKMEVNQAPSPLGPGGVADQRSGHNGCSNCSHKDSSSEKSIQAKIDEALSHKFSAYSGMLEMKVTKIVQHELKKPIGLATAPLGPCFPEIWVVMPNLHIFAKARINPQASI